MMSPHIAAIAERGWKVPAFHEVALQPRGTPYCIIIPVINEGLRIQAQLRQMHELRLDKQADIIIVDGGSTDGSLDQEFLQSVGVRALIKKTGPGKLSAQLRCAYAWALLEGYTGILTIDGNGKDGVETVPNFIAALNEGFDYVQASRFIRGGYSENTPLSRLVAIRLIHAPLQSLAAGYWYTDTTQGYRAYSADFLSDPRVQPFRDVFVRYELLAYLTVRSSQLGYKVKELPTSRSYPKGEAVPTKISGMGALIDLLLVVTGAFLRVYHPKSA